MKWNEFYEKEMAALGEDLIVEAMECNKVTVELKAHYVESRPNIFKNIMTAAACILLAVAMTVSFVLMRRSITPGGQPTTDTETETNEPETTDREPEPDTDTTASEDTEMPVEELPVPEDGEQLVFLCVEKRRTDSNENWKYEYDESGNLVGVVSKYDDKRYVYEMEYNDESELEAVYKNSAQEGTVQKITFSGGKVTACESYYCGELEERIVYDYDANENLISITRESGNGESIVECYEYDDNGNLVRKTKTQGDDEYLCVDEYTYNSIGLMIRQDNYNRDYLEGFYEYEYDDNGNLSRTLSYRPAWEEVDGEMIESYVIVDEWLSYYDENGREIESKSFYKGEFDTHTKYEYDEWGNRTREIEFLESGEIKRELTYKCEADAQGRLTKVKLGSYPGGFFECDEYVFEYDDNGNVVKETLGSIVVTYEYSAVCVPEEMAEKAQKTTEMLDGWMGYIHPDELILYKDIDRTLNPDKYTD